MRVKQPLRIIAGLILAVWLTILGVASLANRGICAWYGHQTGRETRYAMFVGCMVKSPAGHWIPRNELRTSSE